MFSCSNADRVDTLGRFSGGDHDHDECGGDIEDCGCKFLLLLRPLGVKCAEVWVIGKSIS